MKVSIQLTDDEIKRALEKAIKDKIPEAVFYAHHIKLNGSVKFKNKSVRKDVVRLSASVEFTK